MTAGKATVASSESDAALLQRMAELEDRLREAEETLQAIRSGDVDAVIVEGPDGQQQVYTLESADRPYRAVIEQMQEGAITLNGEGIVLYSNRCFAVMVRQAMERVVGSSILDYIRETDQATFLRLLAESRQGKARGDFLLRASDGDLVPAQVSLIALSSGSGDSRLVCGVVTDLSETRRLEEQLRHSQKMDAIGQLTGSVAHDFNNLLMAVMSNLDLLRKRVDADPQALRLINGALEGAKRGASLTQRLLAFARRQDLRTESVDLGHLLHGMNDLLARSVGPLVEMDLQVKPDLPPAKVDANQLELALLNLVLNASDAMPEGGKLTVSLERAETTDFDMEELEAGSYLRLAVQDSGTGMDPDTLRRAVEPFFSTKGSGKGTGLGLAMVHGLARQLGGALRLSSVLGQGTIAELWLPIAERPPRRAHPARPMATDTPAPASILVVDDDALIAMSTADMLRDLGHTVFEAGSGARALEILRTDTPIEILLTDQAMPGMKGTELAKAACALRPSLRVLLVTGYADLSEAVHLPCIGKPYQQDQLARAIAQLQRPPA